MHLKQLWKWHFQKKIAKTAGDLIGNNIAEQNIYLTLVRKQQIIDDRRLI